MTPLRALVIRRELAATFAPVPVAAAGLGLATTAVAAWLGLYAVWVGTWQADLAPLGGFAR